MAETRTIAVPEGLAGERLDVVLSRLFGFSRAFAQDVIDAGGAIVEGKPGIKATVHPVARFSRLPLSPSVLQPLNPSLWSP